MERDEIERLPRLRDGFRHRGREVTRLEAFVDAAFAFAVTLLVVSIDAIPQSIPELIAAMKGVPAFAVSFAMVAMFWAAHARWSRRYGLDDRATTLLSLTLVFLVLVYVYPLKMLFGTFFGWITGGWLPFPLRDVRGYADIATMFVIYGIAFVTLSLCVAGLYLNAWRRRERLGLDERELEATGGEIGQYLYFVLIGCASVLAAVLLSAGKHGWIGGVPGMLYALLSLTGVAYMIGARWARRHATARAP